MIFSLPSLFFRRRQRHVYAFWDGHRVREADPIAALKIAQQHAMCKIDVDLPATENGDLDALERVVGMTREMFDLPVWSQETGGLTMSETLLLLLDFLDFMDRRAAQAKRRPTHRRGTLPAVE